MEKDIRRVLTTPTDFGALEDDGSTKLGLSEQVLAAMARAALTKGVAGVTFNDITAHRDGAGQLTRIDIDYMDQIHDPSSRSVSVQFGSPQN